MTEVASVLFGREDIHRRVQELGRTIAEDYAGREPVMISVLKGGAVFLADLLRATPLPLEPHFMAISRYGGAEESFGRVQILLDVDIDLAGRDVIVVEDIVDTGHTVHYLLQNFGTRQPASIRLCSLLHKPERSERQVTIDYLGFTIPNKYVVGYGLDIAQQYRNLPFIGYVQDPSE